MHDYLWLTHAISLNKRSVRAIRYRYGEMQRLLARPMRAANHERSQSIQPVNSNISSLLYLSKMSARLFMKCAASDYCGRLAPLASPWSWSRHKFVSRAAEYHQGALAVRPDPLQLAPAVECTRKGARSARSGAGQYRAPPGLLPESICRSTLRSIINRLGGAAGVVLAKPSY